MFELKGKVALVTGAQRGMGKADAVALAKQGVQVAVTDINLENCQAVANEIIAAGGQAKAYKMDVSNEAEVDQIFTQVVADFGRLDILVNNAGICKIKPTVDLSLQEWEETIHINLQGQFLCAKRAAKEMMKNKWGRIINIASVASGQSGFGLNGGAHYASSKGGVLALTESLAVEWAPYNITVNAIAPGAIDTPMVQEVKMNKEAQDAMLAPIPLKRMGNPEEIAAGVVFLASEESSYVTGAELVIDGGWLAV